MIRRESDARLIGYGGMLTESFVAIMALCAATALDPGLYFSINAPLASLGGTVENAALHIREWGFVVTPDQIRAMAQSVGESTLLGRVGGAPHSPSAWPRSSAMPLARLIALWYHFAIMFEALFILTVRMREPCRWLPCCRVGGPSGNRSAAPPGIRAASSLRRWWWEAGVTSWCRESSIRWEGSIRSCRCSVSAISCWPPSPFASVPRDHQARQGIRLGDDRSADVAPRRHTHRRMAEDLFPGSPTGILSHAATLITQVAGGSLGTAGSASSSTIGSTP